MLSLTGFAIVMNVTPGPNNVMLASSGANHGIRASVPHMVGIAVGFSPMLIAVSAGLGGVLQAWPPLLTAMRWIGAAWLLVLAWKIATAPLPGTAAPSRVMGFWGAAAFQWINPKAWLITLAAASEFTLPDQPVAWQAIRLGLVFFVVALPCTLVWVLLGRGAARLLRAPGQVRGFNIAMGVLLVASLVPVLAGE